MVNYCAIIDKYYPEADKLRDILIIHSRGVADLALKVFDSHNELFDTGGNLLEQRQFVEAAAMLHDIGIIRCDAAGIECYGSEPYICHGTIGARMIRELDVNDKTFALTPDLQEALARVCERHTGTGLSKEQIVNGNLPLPHLDLVPETLAEQLVCYADKFFSKTRPDKMKTFEHAERSLMKFGEEGLVKFRHWHSMFDL